MEGSPLPYLGKQNMQLQNIPRRHCRQFDPPLFLYRLINFYVRYSSLDELQYICLEDQQHIPCPERPSLNRFSKMETPAWEHYDDVYIVLSSKRSLSMDLESLFASNRWDHSLVRTVL